VGGGLLGCQLGPLGFGYISHSCRCCQATSPPKPLLEHTRGRAAVLSPKYAPPPTKICVAALPKARLLVHLASQGHAAVAKEMPRSSMPTRCQEYPLPRSSMPPRCQEIPAAQELLPKFVVLMLAIYYVLYSIHIISVLDVWEDYTDD